MKYNKFKAFTLAEIMVLLLTLSILMAAFAPVFTRRYSNVTSDEVWTFIAGDPNYDAYFDAPNKIYKSQAFIGLQPKDSAGVDDLVKNSSSSEPLYSKLVIGASNRLGSVSGTPPQQQMQFRYGSSAMGTLVATLFAGNKNMLLGGPYKKITDTAEGQNSSFGIGSLADITSGKRNTAVGAYALTKVGTGLDNTAIGYLAGAELTNGKQNTFVGTYAGAETANAVNNNTFVGYRAGYSVKASENTAVGNYALSGDTSVSDGARGGNTAVGYAALQKASNAYGNTALGAYALQNLVTGDYNTAIGYNACAFIGYSSSKKVSKVTCIGANSAKEDKSGSSGGAGLPVGSNDPDRVFIGTAPNNTTISSNSQKAFAVLEVHNSTNGPNTNMRPVPNGEESVIINGNLVVRGQPYFEAPIFRIGQPGNTVAYDHAVTPKALMLFRLTQDYSTKVKVLNGYDGTFRTGKSYENCNGCSAHKFADRRPNCICTAVGPSYSGNTSYIYSGTSTKRYSSTSYDWFTETDNENGISKSCGSGKLTAKYKDKSTGSDITLARTPGGNSSGDNTWGTRETDEPYAHLKNYSSCCPNLSSDIRLKNVGEKFTAGLDEIKQLKVYNFTFKNDVNKLPQVGVIAQDLKTIFPNAVTKGDDGYYRIRWSEMLYAAVNAVKTLNSKIEALANRVATDKERIATLKRDNAKMYAKLDKLAEELEVLEAKKK